MWREGYPGGGKGVARRGQRGSKEEGRGVAKMSTPSK